MCHPVKPTQTNDHHHHRHHQEVTRLSAQLINSFIFFPIFAISRHSQDTGGGRGWHGRGASRGVSMGVRGRGQRVK